MRAIPVLLASASVVGALLVLQSALFFVMGRGPDALQVGWEANLLGLGLPLALAMVSWRGARPVVLGTYVCAALSVVALAASRLSVVEAPPCDDTASCLAPDQPALVMLGLQAHLVLLLGAAVLGALACAIAHALPGRARWLPLGSLALSFAALPLTGWAQRAGLGDHLTSLGAAMSAVVAAAVVLLLARAPPDPRGVAEDARSTR